MKEKNVSGLTKTLAAMTLLVPVSAQALGIGDIRLHSSLNQNLNAEIMLTLAPGENPSDVSVRLAPPEKFDQAGVPWSYFLSKLHFQTVTRGDGNMIVKITSREALTEPFLNFLVEVSWPQGAQTREFTILIDPPSDYRPAPTLPSVASSALASETTQDEYYDRPVRKPRATKRRATTRTTESQITQNTPASGEYGPTRVSETLWGIAERLGAEKNVPTRQMMNALFQANPEAFNRGDMDSMKAGVVLRIPEMEGLQTASTSTPRKAKSPTQPIQPADEKGSGKALELVAPSESKIAETTRNDARPSADSTGSEGGTTSSAGSTASTQDLALQARIEKLEQQLNMMQELLALKDQQLAVLQNKDQKPTVQVEQSPVTPPVTTQPTPTPTADVATGKPTATPPTEVQPPAKEVREAVTPATPAAQPKPVAPPTPKPTVVAPPEEESLLDSPDRKSVV